MKIARIFIMAVGLLLTAGIVAAQETSAPPQTDQTIAPRTLGSQTFQIDLGLMVPLFSQPIPYYGAGYVPAANLSLGGALRLKYSAFLDPDLAIGADLAGMIAGGPNTVNSGTIFALINIGPHISYFFRLGNFEIPVSLSPNFTIMNYGSNTYLGFGLRPGIGIYYDATPSWSFGLNVQYWWQPEIKPAAAGIPDQSRVGNLLEISLSALYSF